MVHGGTHVARARVSARACVPAAPMHSAPSPTSFSAFASWENTTRPRLPSPPQTLCLPARVRAASAHSAPVPASFQTVPF